MRKIIDNKAYDTNTAKRIAYWENTFDNQDFNWWCEVLYKKRTGEFFLYVDSNDLGKYGYSRFIRPLGEEGVKEWVLEYANTHYEELFGEVEE